MNPRELVACAEAAMMTAKTRGKNRVVLFEEDKTERPDGSGSSSRDVRSIAHLKMLQSLAGKLNRLNDVQKIGYTIANELRTLIDYHNAARLHRRRRETHPHRLSRRAGAVRERRSVAARRSSARWAKASQASAALANTSLLIPNALDCDFAEDVEGTDDIEESMHRGPLVVRDTGHRRHRRVQARDRAIRRGRCEARSRCWRATLRSPWRTLACTRLREAKPRRPGKLRTSPRPSLISVGRWP